jgi:hypothetical protein
VNSGVTVCIASIPIRRDALLRSIASALDQTVPPEAIVVEIDHGHTGAGPTKTRALRKATTEWTVMLDDDDELMPTFVERHLESQAQTGVDVTYAMPYRTDSPGGHDGCGLHGQPFDPDELRRRSYIHGTSLIRTRLLQISGFQRPAGSDYDDWGAFLALLDHGATFFHLTEQLFIWNISQPSSPGQPGNTSGLGERW